MTRRDITTEFTSRPDGNGNPIPGWYVVHFGYPIGPAHESQAAAETRRVEYLRDLANCLALQ